MSVNDLELIASRLRFLLNEAVEFGQSRDTILLMIEEVANDIQDEADTLALAMAREYANA